MTLPPYITGDSTSHRSDEFAIIKRIARFLQEVEDVPEFADAGDGLYRRIRSVVLDEGAAHIMRAHDITDLALYYWFASRAEELLDVWRG